MTTAYHWRYFRSKLVLAGICDPMALSSMHMLLDIAESTILESISSSREKDAEYRRAEFIDRLYSPANDTSGAPAGFAPDDVEAAFDAFAAATAGSAV